MKTDEIAKLLEDAYFGQFDIDTAFVHLAAIEDSLLRSELLQQLASRTTENEFALSEELNEALLESIKTSMINQPKISKMGVESPRVRAILKQILLKFCDLHDILSHFSNGKSNLQ